MRETRKNAAATKVKEMRDAHMEILLLSQKYKVCKQFDGVWLLFSCGSSTTLSKHWKTYNVKKLVLRINRFGKELGALEIKRKAQTRLLFPISFCPSSSYGTWFAIGGDGV